jgi:putative phosphoesterase
MKIGVVSDTHNYFDPAIPKLLHGVDHIIHGGDIGSPRILLALEQIAPVTAVLGNTDDPGHRYRLTETVELGSQKFLVHHIVNPHRLDDHVTGLIAHHHPDVVVFGHTHKAFREEIDGILFFNPGYAGQSRFGMERSLAILHLESNEVRHEFLLL